MLNLRIAAFEICIESNLKECIEIIKKWQNIKQKYEELSQTMPKNKTIAQSQMLTL